MKNDFEFLKQKIGKYILFQIPEIKENPSLMDVYNQVMKKIESGINTIKKEYDKSMQKPLTPEARYNLWKIDTLRDLKDKFKSYLETCDDRVEKDVLNSINSIEKFIGSIESSKSPSSQNQAESDNSLTPDTSEDSTKSSYESPWSSPIYMSVDIEDYWMEQVTDILNFFDFERVERLISSGDAKFYENGELSKPSLDGLKYYAFLLMMKVILCYRENTHDKANTELTYKGAANGFVSEILYNKETKKPYITLQYILI